MKKKFIDTNIKNKSLKIDETIQYLEVNGKKLPLPAEIEISESGTCNRTCSFCPRSAPDYKDIKDFISLELHQKLCVELKEINYRGTIRYSGFVEPLLDKNIFNLLKMARTLVPQSNIEIVTNGDSLNLERLKKLFSNGLNKLLISVYDGYDDLLKFEKMCSEAMLNNNQFHIRPRYLPEKENFGITLTNRAGMMKNAEFKINDLKKPLKNPCYIPAYTFFLDYQGDILMCPHDWGKKIILGNLNKETLLDIWYKKRSIYIRSQLIDGNRNFTPCNVCDVTGTFMGKKHANGWKS